MRLLLKGRRSRLDTFDLICRFYLHGENRVLCPAAAAAAQWRHIVAAKWAFDKVPDLSLKDELLRRHFLTTLKWKGPLLIRDVWKG